MINDYLKPWINGDLQGQYDTGYQEGYKKGMVNWGCPDGPLESTSWGRGYCDGYKASQKDKEYKNEKK